LGESRVKKILLSFLLMLSAGAHAKEYVSLTCQGEISGGIYKDGDQWRSADFMVQSFSIKLQIDGGLVMMELDDALWSCLPIDGDPEYISCADLSWPSNIFVFTKDFARFMHGNTNVYSYLLDQGDTAQIEAGTCERI